MVAGIHMRFRRFFGLESVAAGVALKGLDPVPGIIHVLMHGMFGREGAATALARPISRLVVRGDVLCERLLAVE